MNSKEASIKLCHCPYLDSTIISDHALHTELSLPLYISVYAYSNIFVSCFHLISSTLMSTTVPTVPSPPRMLTTNGEPTGSTIELNWLPPLHPNGAIHYEIEYEPAVTPGDTVNAGSSSIPYFTLTLPNEFLTYNVRVTAVNTQGQAQSSVITVCPGQNREQGVQYMVLVYPTVVVFSICCIREASNDSKS